MTGDLEQPLPTLHSLYVSVRDPMISNDTAFTLVRHTEPTEKAKLEEGLKSERLKMKLFCLSGSSW